MNLAAGMALGAATLNLSTAVLFFVLARAPGWRVCRLLTAIALTAGIYNLLSLVFSIPGLPSTAYRAAGQAIYGVGSLHCVGWLVFAFGGSDGSPRALPPTIRGLAWGTLLTGLGLAATGWHLAPQVSIVDVPWAGVEYHFPETTPVGTAYGLVLPGLLALVFLQLIRRCRQGERALRWHLLGFSLFFACTVVEVLVANRTLQFLSLADVGFLFVVLPLSGHVVHRILQDGRRLHALSGRLEGEVRDRTAERDQAQEALAEAEHLAALGRLASGVSHEINNPLTYLLLSLSEVEAHLSEADSPEPVRAALANAREGARRIRQVVERLRGQATGPSTRHPVDPRELLHAALKIATPQLRHATQLDVRLGEVPRVLGDAPRLVQALVHLLTNAAQAVETQRGDGRITVHTATRPDGHVEFCVADNGPGVTAADLARWAEPYFTTRAGRGALGLGLFVTRGIVSAHGGQLLLSSAPGRGTEARITLPPSPDAPPDHSPKPAPAHPTPAGWSAPSPVEKRRGRLLLVDDEPLVLNVLRRGLQRWWDITTATSGHQALDLTDRQSFDAVVSDLMMPEMSGMAFAEEVARRNPALRQRMLFLTGGALTTPAQQFLTRPDVRHLVKPVDIACLHAALDHLADQEPLPAGNG